MIILNETYNMIWVHFRTSDPQSPNGMDPEVLKIIAQQLRVKLNFTYIHWGHYDIVSNTGFGLVGTVRYVIPYFLLFGFQYIFIVPSLWKMKWMLAWVLPQ